jgi:hypothetical protein
MERISMAAQGADGESVVGDNLLKVRQGRRIVEHRELAMGVAHIIPCGEFNSIDLKPRKPLEHRLERKLGK